MFKTKNIYLKENLTPQRYHLFKETKRYARENNFKFIWTRDGNILIRKTESSNAHHVRCESELTGLAQLAMIEQSLKDGSN